VLTEPDGQDQELADLVQAAQRRQPAAFDQLYRHYLGLVRGVVAGEGCERNQLDDVVQEVFTQAWQRLPALRDPKRFRPWLLQITRRTLIDQARKARRRPYLLPDDHSLSSMTSTAPSPEECVEAVDLASRISAVIASMSARDVTLLQRAVDRHERCPSSSASDVDGRGAAKVALHRARARLADYLEATA
jgi:RNA polymerase sigma factor (sigma-70 family)